jgi:hypothetical protein
MRAEVCQRLSVGGVSLARTRHCIVPELPPLRRHGRVGGGDVFTAAGELEEGGRVSVLEVLPVSGR